MPRVGLFWIAEGDVYVGAKPSGPGSGVRLTPEGVVALGDGQSGFYLWEDVNVLTVADVPVKSLKRQVRVVKDLALETVREPALPMGHGRVDEAPAVMSEWGRAWEGGSPRRAEREGLLRGWVGSFDL